MKAAKELAEAIEDFDRDSVSARLQRGEEQRREILERFSEDHWPEMTLDEFALGQENSEETFCRWMEFRSPDLGSIRGGTSRKLVIYKHKDKPGWHFPKEFQDEKTAWTQLRSDFVEALELARAGKWEEIDGLEALAQGPALRLKTLHVYLPNEILPVYSNDHLRHFLRLLGRPDEEAIGYAVVRTNRNLLAALRAVPALADWKTTELGPFLYSWMDPRDAHRVVKVAPGQKARYWDDCLQGGYICVGWDDVGDLSEFDSKEAFRETFEQSYPYNGHRASVVRKSNELWTLAELVPGDLVVANQGTSKVLAVGTVVEPCYQWREDRESYKHTVTVEWDTRFEKAIPPQKAWATVTVKKVPDALFEEITSGGSVSGPKQNFVIPVDPFYVRVADALERKGQAILYGPPGTGKTYTARRFAVWWLLRQGGNSDSNRVLGDAQLMARQERSLSDGDVAPLTRITFHPSYTYEDFIEGFRPAGDGRAGLRLQLEDGVFKRICRAAEAHPDRPYLLLVDEINRGNVAKILGELLTLLERDKRGLTVALPQSKEMFSIPRNVYLLGTMNTADRSIKLLDAALRRRFSFLELMPDLELLRGASVGDLALDEFLEELNRRIAQREGREKQIGHAYLLDGGDPVAEPDGFACCFREEILPLLQEYCYDEYDTLAGFIGGALVDADAQSLDQEKVGDPEQLVAALAAEFSGPGEIGASEEAEEGEGAT